jgi:hypothetical protein
MVNWWPAAGSDERQHLNLGELLSRWGVAKLVKAADFDSAIRGFESFLPSHSDLD